MKKQTKIGPTFKIKTDQNQTSPETFPDHINQTKVLCMLLNPAIYAFDKFKTKVSSHIY